MQFYNPTVKWDLAQALRKHLLCVVVNIQGVSGGIVNILGGCSIDYSE
jgi:hypothetical protein